MGGSDSDAATRTGGADIHLDGGGGEDADIHHFASGGEQAAGDGMLEHFAAGSGVAADHYAACADIGAEGLSEGAGEAGGEEVADNAADAGDADFE